MKKLTTEQQATLQLMKILSGYMAYEDLPYYQQWRDIGHSFFCSMLNFHLWGKDCYASFYCHRNKKTFDDLYCEIITRIHIIESGDAISMFGQEYLNKELQILRTIRYEMFLIAASLDYPLKQN